MATNTRPSSAQPSSSYIPQKTRAYGHRVIIASLHLPETITFHEFDDSVIASPNNQSSAPPSPSAEAHHLPIHELGNRLAGVSAAFKDRSERTGSGSNAITTTDSGAIAEDEEGPPLPPLHAQPQPSTFVRSPDSKLGSGSNTTSTSAPRRHSSSANDTSFTKPHISMTDLMAEATRPPPGEVPPPPEGSKSRRGSSSGGVRPNMASIAPVTPTPSSSVADHGRGQESTKEDGYHGTNARYGPHRGHPTTGSGTTSFSIGMPQPSSRRGSLTTGNSPSGGSTIPLPGSGAPGPGTGTRKPSEPAGTRTPGGAIAGKAGTLVPLSIIDDLQARQSHLSASHTPTPGDAERHHPFGGGAVTPFRGSQTPGVAARTPGLPTGSQTPGTANRGFQSALHGRPQPTTGLSMTKTNDKPNAKPASAQGAATTGANTPFRSFASKADAKVTATSRPPLGQHRPSTKTASALGSGSFNDHGRGVVTEDPAHGATRQNLSDSTHSDPTRHSIRHKKVAYVSDEETASASSGSPTNERPHGSSHRTGRPASGASGPPTAPSSGMSRSGSRPRPSSGRRLSGMRKQNRRSSADTVLSTFAEDIGLDDSPDGGSDYVSDRASVYGHSGKLPPHDFVPNPASNGGLVNAVCSLSEQRKLRHSTGGRLFIGTPGICADEDWMTPRHRFSLTTKYRDERSSVPVWLNSDVLRGAYQNFCKGILWPVFHYTLPTDKALENEHESFEHYRELNMIFARKIAEEYRDGDIVLINDYHLLLVPQMLRELIPSAAIGLFIHIAFPSSELFRCLAMRETLLRGMLGADLVGFQTHNFCRHFRQTVSRILQLEATPKGVQTETFFTTVSSFPIGIDPRNLNAKRADPEVREWVAKLTERYEGKKVIVGRDKLDWIRGVRQKLLAFEVFLNEHPEWVGRVVLIQVALATNEENEEAGEANDVVSRINSKYASLTYQPVVFLHVQDITFSQYLALLTVADGFLANSLREGMNLTTHEYIICQEEKQSPLILSEFTGTYSALRACIGINPWNAKQVAHAIHKALVMPQEEQHARWEDLHRTVVTQTALQWITSLLSRLERAHIEQQRRDNAFIPRLEIGQLVSEWRASKTRLVLLDLEGTLMPESTLLLQEVKDFKVPSEVLQVLQELSLDAKNSVYILSSLSTGWLDKVAEEVPKLGIIAEDGCAVKHPGRSEWISLTAGLNNAWKVSVTEILRYFQDRTPGSFLHNRGATLFFSSGQVEGDEDEQHASQSFLGSGSSHQHSTRSQESQWARRQLAEINNLVYDSLGERFSLRIIPRGTTLTVMPKNISRASAVQHVVQLQAMGVLSEAPLQTDTSAMRTPEVETESFDPSADVRLDHRSSSAAAQPRDQGGVAPTTLSLPTPIGSRSVSTVGAGVLKSSDSSGSINDALGSGDVKGPNHPDDSMRRSANNSSSSAAGATQGYSFSGNCSPSSSRILSQAHQSFFSSIGPAGNFDFALYLGQDERLMNYVASLDLPFAPLTCTTSNIDFRGSEAGFSLPAEEVLDALKEITHFRRRDMRWGVPASVDI